MCSTTGRTPGSSRSSLTIPASFGQYVRPLDSISCHVKVSALTQTIAFDAHILKWSINSPPEPYLTRHHIKEASFYGVNQWTLELLIQLPAETIHPEQQKLKVNFMGLVEKRGWPGKKLDGDDSPSLEMLSMIDAYVHETSGDSVDMMLVGCVGGFVEL